MHSNGARGNPTTVQPSKLSWALFPITPSVRGDEKIDGSPTLVLVSIGIHWSIPTVLNCDQRRILCVHSLRSRSCYNVRGYWYESVFWSHVALHLSAIGNGWCFITWQMNDWNANASEREGWPIHPFNQSWWSVHHWSWGMVIGSGGIRSHYRKRDERIRLEPLRSNWTKWIVLSLNHFSDWYNRLLIMAIESSS